MKSGLSFERDRGNMRRSRFLTAVLLSLLLCASPALSTSPDGHDYGAQPRFICTPVPVDADPACFGGAGGSSGSPGRHGAAPEAAAGGPSPSGWWGMPDEAKATILHLRESLLKEKETVFQQRETIREMNAKLALCESFSRPMTADDDHSGHRNTHHHHRLQVPPSTSSSWHGGGRPGGHHRAGKSPGHHHRGSNLLPDAALSHSAGAGAHRAATAAGHVGHDRMDNKHTVAVTTAGERTSPPEQTGRMLQALKERLENLQQRNVSSAYSSSLKDLLQRKISTMEQQLHPPPPAHRPDDTTSALSGPRHHDHDDSRPDDSDGGHHDDTEQGDPHKDYDDLDDAHDGDSNHDDDDEEEEEEEEEEGHHDNEDEDGYGYVEHTGYRPHSNALENILNHLSGPDRTKADSPDSFQIGFPMRTNYMYSRMKRTLPNEIFALTLCLWIKGGAGPGLGTPFSYSVPGQANELVLIEWGNNPMELLVADNAVTLPLSLGDGKWHHVCVTWSTREGQWEAYQDGVQRGSGDSLSPWHPVKPGGVFIIGQEQDTLGGRFDATQSFVGEISDLHMWSHVLTAGDIHSLASCGSHLTGDVLAWSEAELEHHGGVSVYPSDPCHDQH